MWDLASILAAAVRRWGEESIGMRGFNDLMEHCEIPLVSNTYYLAGSRSMLCGRACPVAEWSKALQLTGGHCCTGGPAL